MPELICLIGLDGCGKSSQIDRLVDQLNNAGIRTDRRWCRWNPFLMRGIMVVFKKLLFGNKHSISMKADSQNPKEDYRAWKKSKARLFRKKLLRQGWILGMMVDYWFQVLKHIILPLKQCDVLIADRYLPDVAVDQAIHFPELRQGLATILRHPLTCLYPKPTLVIWIEISPETAFSRKDDIPCLEFLEDRQQAYLALREFMPVAGVNGEQSMEAVNREILQIIESHLGRSLCYNEDESVRELCP
jgi:thymidylate kinase